MSALLFHEVELVMCTCGHPAIEHHGVDTSPHNGGCFADGSGFAWSAQPKCPCTLTAPMVLGASS